MRALRRFLVLSAFFCSAFSLADSRIVLNLNATPIFSNRMEILKPVDLASMNNEYQTATLVSESESTVVVDVSRKLIDSYADQVSENPNWQKDYSGMGLYLSPGLTANYDAQMQSDLKTALLKAGINVDLLTDKQVVEQVSAWLMKTFAHDNFFIPYYVIFKNGTPQVHPRARKHFDYVLAQKNVATDADAFNRGLLGKEMFYAKKHGDCTATAILMSTVLRALGIPTRLVLTVPAIDTNDSPQVVNSQKELMKSEIGLRASEVFKDLAQHKGAFVAHTFNEVFVGKQWVKLNYNQLGQGSVWAVQTNGLWKGMGVFTQVNTLNDWSDAGDIIETWGVRFATGVLSPALSSINPYRSVD